jgi:SPX domain protein involved in polyphosphate accumulation
MAAPIVNFCRTENKYPMQESRIESLANELRKHLDTDPYAIHNGHYQVNTIYFDDENNNVVERSVAHPMYKEKLRLRSYGGAKPIYFIEFKNKYTSDVFKCRIILSEKEYQDFVFHQILPSRNGQYLHDRFLDSLELFIARHPGGIFPKSVIQYDRMAFVNRPYDAFCRVTIDTNILFRRDNFNLNEPGGEKLLPSGECILEIKVGESIPLWLAHAINALEIYRIPFSKYGTSFLDVATPKKSESEKEESSKSLRFVLSN